MKGNEIKMGIINRQIPITISNSDCTWNSFEKSITVKGDISGTIPTEELGIKNIDSCPIITDKATGTFMPQDISVLLKQPFKVFITNYADGKYVFSRKAYLEYCKDELVVGEIYKAVVYGICAWGIFCKIGDAIVLVHITNWSRCRFYNARSISYPGQIIKVKILSKKKDVDGSIRVVASRKDVESNVFFIPGEEVIVTLSRKTCAGDGFFCELTPDTCGIVDVYPEDIPYLIDGMRVVAVVKKCSPKGYKLRYSHLFRSNY